MSAHAGFHYAAPEIKVFLILCGLIRVSWDLFQDDWWRHIVTHVLQVVKGFFRTLLGDFGAFGLLAMDLFT